MHTPLISFLNSLENDATIVFDIDVHTGAIKTPVSVSTSEEDIATAFPGQLLLSSTTGSPLYPRSFEAAKIVLTRVIYDFYCSLPKSRSLATLPAQFMWKETRKEFLDMSVSVHDKPISVHVDDLQLLFQTLEPMLGRTLPFCSRETLVRVAVNIPVWLLNEEISWSSPDVSSIVPFHGHPLWFPVGTAIVTDVHTLLNPKDPSVSSWTGKGRPLFYDLPITENYGFVSRPTCRCIVPGCFSPPFTANKFCEQHLANFLSQHRRAFTPVQYEDDDAGLPAIVFHTNHALPLVCGGALQDRCFRCSTLRMQLPSHCQGASVRCSCRRDVDKEDLNDITTIPGILLRQGFAKLWKTMFLDLSPPTERPPSPPLSSRFSIVPNSAKVFLLTGEERISETRTKSDERELQDYRVLSGVAHLLEVECPPFRGGFQHPLEYKEPLFKITVEVTGSHVRWRLTDKLVNSSPGAFEELSRIWKDVVLNGASAARHLFDDMDRSKVPAWLLSGPGADVTRHVIRDLQFSLQVRDFVINLTDARRKASTSMTVQKEFSDISADVECLSWISQRLMNTSAALCFEDATVNAIDMHELLETVLEKIGTRSPSKRLSQKSVFLKEKSSTGKITKLEKKVQEYMVKHPPSKSLSQDGVNAMKELSMLKNQHYISNRRRALKKVSFFGRRKVQKKKWIQPISDDLETLELFLDRLTAFSLVLPLAEEYNNGLEHGHKSELTKLKGLLVNLGWIKRSQQVLPVILAGGNAALQSTEIQDNPAHVSLVSVFINGLALSGMLDTPGTLKALDSFDLQAKDHTLEFQPSVPRSTQALAKTPAIQDIVKNSLSLTGRSHPCLYIPKISDPMIALANGIRSATDINTMLEMFPGIGPPDFTVELLKDLPKPEQAHCISFGTRGDYLVWMKGATRSLETSAKIQRRGFKTLMMFGLDPRLMLGGPYFVSLISAFLLRCDCVFTEQDLMIKVAFASRLHPSAVIFQGIARQLHIKAMKIAKNWNKDFYSPVLDAKLSSSLRGTFDASTVENSPEVRALVFGEECPVFALPEIAKELLTDYRRDPNTPIFKRFLMTRQTKEPCTSGVQDILRSLGPFNGREELSGLVSTDCVTEAYKPGEFQSLFDKCRSVNFLRERKERFRFTFGIDATPSNRPTVLNINKTLGIFFPSQEREQIATETLHLPCSCQKLLVVEMAQLQKDGPRLEILFVQLKRALIAFRRRKYFDVDLKQRLLLHETHCLDNIHPYQGEEHLRIREMFTGIHQKLCNCKTVQQKKISPTYSETELKMLMFDARLGS